MSSVLPVFFVLTAFIFAFYTSKEQTIEILINGKNVDKESLTMKIGDKISLKIQNSSNNRYRFDSVIVFFIPDIGGQQGYIEGREPKEKQVLRSEVFERSPKLDIDYSAVKPKRGGLLGYLYTRMIVRILKISKKNEQGIETLANDITLAEYSFYKPNVRESLEKRKTQ